MGDLFALDAHVIPWAVLIGAVVGFLSGLFGVGGGFLLTPLVNTFLGIPFTMTVGSDVTQILGTSGAALLRHRKQGNRPAIAVAGTALAGMILGRATEAVGLAHLGESGVDEQAGMVFKYEGGRLAVMATSVQTQTPMEATILGTEGRIRCHGPWWRGNPLTVEVNGRDPETIDVPKVGNGYNYEADEVARCIAAGKTESDAMPLDETLHVIRMMDSLRKQWGLKYPFE